MRRSASLTWITDRVAYAHGFPSHYLRVSGRVSSPELTQARRSAIRQCFLTGQHNPRRIADFFGMDRNSVLLMVSDLSRPGLVSLPWSQEEDDYLLELHQRGLSLGEMAERLADRKPPIIDNRLWLLRKSKPTRKPYDPTALPEFLKAS